MLIRLALSLLLLLVVEAHSASSQHSRPDDSEEKLAVTSFVDCLHDPLTSRTVTSPILCSPDESCSAFVVVSATASSGEPGTCSNLSQLYVYHRGEAQSRPVYELKPLDSDVQGNGLTLVDWHPKRHLLAIALHWWVTSGDGVGGTILEIYDADRKHVIKPDLKSILVKSFPADCRAGLQDVVGFTADGKLAIRVFEDVDQYEAIDNPPIGCFSNGGDLWYLDLDSRTLSRPSESNPVMRFGKIEAVRKGLK